MQGEIKTFVPEKGYGFIKGDDDKDYFFHVSSFKDQNQFDGICEAAVVSFEQAATSKGYQAKKCVLLNSSSVKTYIVPEDFITSKSDTVKGWEIIEKGDWIVHGSSSDSGQSPNVAKRNAIHNAEKIGANALLELEYYKTTGAKPSDSHSSFGTYNFTIHHYRGRIAKVAKRNSKGSYKLGELEGLNEDAEQLKERLVKETRSNIKRHKNTWGLVLVASFFLMGLLPENVAAAPFFVLVIGYFFVAKPEKLDKWLEKVAAPSVL